MPGRFEIFDHTADAGIRVFAPTLHGLIPPAAEALYSLLGEIRAGPTGCRVSMNLTHDDPALLLRDFLAELLHLFTSQQRVITAFDVVDFGERELRVEGQSSEVDMETSVLAHEVKAITYHELAVVKLGDEYVATVIVDL